MTKVPSSVSQNTIPMKSSKIFFMVLTSLSVVVMSIVSDNEICTVAVQVSSKSTYCEYCTQ